MFLCAGCVNGYLECVAYDTIPSRILVYEAVAEDPVYSGYRSAVQYLFLVVGVIVKMSFASWEPPHGPYKSFRYPWALYVKVGGALRHCAIMVMALHGCILSEIQAAEDRRREFRNELQRVGIEGAKVLRYIGESLKKMEKLNPIEDILYEIHQAAEELQSKIDKKSYLLVNAKNWEIGNRPRVRDLTDEQKISNLDSDLSRILAHKSQSEATLRPPKNWDDVTTAANLSSATMLPYLQSRTMIHKQPSWPSRISITPGSMLQPPLGEPGKMYESASNLSLATFASLLIEFVARLENLVNAYDELSVKANFKEAVSE